MTHRFVHLGDLHLRPDARNAARLATLDQAIEECLALPALAAWLWPGDLNHGRMSIEDRNALSVRLQRMADRAPVVLCYGNHDLPGDLDVFARLAAAHPIDVIDRPHVLACRTATGRNAAIFVLPYPATGGLLAQRRHGAALLQEARALLEPIVMHAAGELETARRLGWLTLMIGHLNVAGSVASVGQPQVGQEIELDIGLLDRLGRCPTLLNHIHKAQAIGGATYAGSLCRLDWGEIEDKRYVVLELDDDGSFEIRSCPVRVAPLYHVEGILTRDDFRWDVTAGPDGQPLEPPASWDGCEVRVRYRFHAAERDVLDDCHVRAAFDGAARLVLEPIAVSTREVRAPAVSAAASLADKLTAWAPADVTPGLLAKLAALETTDAERVLTDIRATR